MSGFGEELSEEDRQLHVRLGELRLEHRDLDSAIGALSTGIVQDQLQLARLKKKKLMLKDQILKLENELIPDIIA